MITKNKALQLAEAVVRKEVAWVYEQGRKFSKRVKIFKKDNGKVFWQVDYRIVIPLPLTAGEGTSSKKNY